MESMELSQYKDKKVLVTGYTGFKGSWLCKWLELLGARVYGYSLPLEVEDHFSKLDISGEFISGDINDLSKLQKVIKQTQPEIVFHLAAQALVRESYSDPIHTFETNVLGTAKILEASREMDSIKAIVVVTSDKCYENREWDRGYKENDTMGGYDPYSASKGCAELLVSSYRRSFFSLDTYKKEHNTLIATARAGNVMGGGDWSADRLIPDLIRSAQSGQAVEIRYPDAIRPWQHVLDCLHGYLRLGLRLVNGEAEFADAWNFGPFDSSICDVKTLVNKVQEHWSAFKFIINSDSDTYHEANCLKLDSSKANQLLGWQPVWDLDTSIARTVTWYKDYYQSGELNTNADLNEYMKCLEEVS